MTKEVEKTERMKEMERGKDERKEEYARRYGKERCLQDVMKPKFAIRRKAESIPTFCDRERPVLVEIFITQKLPFAAHCIFFSSTFQNSKYKVAFSRKTSARNATREHRIEAGL